MFRLNRAATISVGSLSLLLAPALAEAHFQLVAPTNWWTQDLSATSRGGPQKTPPCGDPNEAPAQKASGVVNVYQAGQPVTVTVTATVPHPGWWRISLREGAASTQNATNFPEPPETGAPNSDLQCTPAFINNPVWSPTQPVIADKLGLPAGATVAQAMATMQTGTQNYPIMVPAGAHCSMATPCTLQVMMIMTDHVFPSCNYHHCADMALAGSATGTGGSTGTVDAGTRDASAGTGGRTGAGGAGGATVTGTGGATVTGTGGAPSGGTGGSTTGSSGGTTGGGSGGAMAGAGGSSGGGQDSGTGGTTGSDNGCNCAVGGSVGGTSTTVLLLALVALKRRRRKNAC